MNQEGLLCNEHQRIMPAASVNQRFNKYVSSICMVAMFCSSIAISGCAVSRSPVTGKKRAYAYSWDQEVNLGREADPQIVAQYGDYCNFGWFNPPDQLQGLLDTLKSHCKDSNLMNFSYIKFCTQKHVENSSNKKHPRFLLMKRM